VELEEVLIRHCVPLLVADQDGRHDGYDAVNVITLVSGDLEWGARGIGIGDVLVAVTLQVGVEAAVVVDL
jgi:hypothetical protein